MRTRPTSALRSTTRASAQVPARASGRSTSRNGWRGRRRSPAGEEMKLYYFPGSCALADHVVLEWTGAPYEAIKLDRAGTKSPEFLQLNPSGAVPVLVDGDFVLTQNVAILSYLAEQHPKARLFGDRSEERFCRNAETDL